MTKSNRYRRRVQRHLETIDQVSRDLFTKMSKFAGINWEGEDYDPEDDGRYAVQDIEEAEAFGSLIREVGEPDALDPFPEAPGRFHMLALDIDVPATLRPSSTPGHHHLLVDLDIPEEHLFEFLDAAVKIGLIEEGYAEVSKSRGETFVRAPWVTKGQPVDPEHTPLDTLRENAAQGLALGMGIPRYVLGVDPATPANMMSNPLVWRAGPTRSNHASGTAIDLSPLRRPATNDDDF